MVDNAGLGPAYAYGSPDIPPYLLYFLLDLCARTYGISSECTRDV